MKSKIFWLLITFIVLFSIIFVSCSSQSTSTSSASKPTSSTSAPTSTAAKPTSTAVTSTAATSAAPTTTSATKANWWDKFGEPQYGGTLVIRRDNLQLTFDPWTPWNHCWFINDVLFAPDWTLDRSIWDFQTAFAPESYCKPNVAESWEWTDPQNVTVHIRQGVKWQNKAPANGRDFTAEDVQYHYDRILGTGSGFTETDGNLLQFAAALDRVTAVDKYTAHFKFKNPCAFMNSQCLVEIFIQLFELPELVKSGGIDKWENAIGNGAFMLTDYTQSTQATFTKNPDYWAKDERHPQNKIPYVDSVKVLCIPDTSTSLAAMRTGKIDLMNNLDIMQSEQLTKSNPEIQQIQVATASISMNMRNDLTPFSDINVRRALNMAIDRPTIAKVHYGGKVDPTPQGTVYAKFTGWSFPYEQWPQADKDWHTYNLTAARKLLTDAGYPNGFKMTAVIASTSDTALAQIIKAEFLDIGVDMTIQAEDFVTAMQIVQNGKFDSAAFGQSNNPHHPNVSLQSFYGTSQQLNACHINDADYNAMFDKFLTATTVDESKKLSVELDKYVVQHYWRVDLFPISTYTALQPKVHGYSGESLQITDEIYWARMWVTSK